VIATIQDPKMWTKIVEVRAVGEENGYKSIFTGGISFTFAGCEAYPVLEN
jgi:hypothetical protein